MARKGNQRKDGLDKRSPIQQKGVSDSPIPQKGVLDSGLAPLPAEDRGDVSDKEMALGEGLQNIQDGKKSKKRSKKSNRKERKGMEDSSDGQAIPSNDKVEIFTSDTPIVEASNTGDEHEVPPNDIHNSPDVDNFANLPNTLHRENGMGNVEFPETEIFRFMKTVALSIARASAEWVERHKTSLTNLKTNTRKACDYVQMKIQCVLPIVLKWMMHIGNILLLLSMVWLDCSLRGIDSFLRMGTTSFFSIVWCSVLSVIAMVGISKFLIMTAVTMVVVLFLGITIALVLSGIAGMYILWLYGSFWTTGFVIILGVFAFLLSHDRIALFVTSAYSIYCAWNYVGWLGLVLGLNLSFVSSDALLFFLKHMMNEQRRPNGFPEQAAETQGQPSFFWNESAAYASSTGNGASNLQSDRNPGMPSTSGSDVEMTSEDEVVRLLNCADHYAALGLARFENIDASAIKREYRKKAMLVHPDKNMGNEKAAEAFKKLQNAYEVLLDSFKRKEYDDELRREELLNYFRKFQSASHEKRGHGLFSSGFGHTEADSEELLGESRRIACRKCGFFHVWVYTKKPKSRARWCQECKDFHQAKDGDGWVEQSSQPFFFGILQKVEAPSAYVCAGGKIYDATEWYICQGLRCPVNTHKPTFHVNTNVMSKNSHGKGTSSGQRGGIPTPNMEETMTEEEFFEWLQNAVQSGAFENFAGSSSETPPGFNQKAGSGNSSAGNSKKKKKGKKPW